MAFTGNEDHDFPLDQAAEWTKNYRNANPGATLGHFFGKDAVQELLDQDNCVGLRIYYALDAADTKQLIVVGVKANEDDMYTGIILERSFKCPQACGIANPLNSQ